MRSLAARDEPAIRAMVSRIIEERIDGRPVRRMRPDAARPRAHPRGVRRTAPRDVPHRASPTRRTRSSSSSRGARRPAAAAGERPGLVTRAIYLGSWRVDLSVRDGVTAPLPGTRAGPMRGVRTGRGRRSGPRLDRADPVRRRRARPAQRRAPRQGRSDRRAVVPAPAAGGVPAPRRRRRVARDRPPARPTSRCRPAAGRTSATSSSRSSGRSSRPAPAAAARPGTCAGRRPTSCACWPSTARSTSAAGTTPSRSRRRRCARSRGVFLVRPAGRRTWARPSPRAARSSGPATGRSAPGCATIRGRRRRPRAWPGSCRTPGRDGRAPRGRTGSSAG